MTCAIRKPAVWIVIVQVLLTWMPNVGGWASEPAVAPAAASTGNGQATNPKPDTGGFFVDGSKKPALVWRPGQHAVKQNVYFGNTAAEVLESRKPSVADLPGDVASIRLPVAQPVVGKTYFWRVESINGDNRPTTAGEVWSVRIIPKKLKIYLLGGQSNANGCSPCDDLPAELIGPQKNVIIFARGGIQVKEYGWDWLRDGLGNQLNDRGKGTFGPELTFGVRMSKARPGEVIGIIKCAWNATNLGWSWRSPSAGERVGTLYTKFIEAMREAVAALDPAFEPELAGMIWMQGESDSDNRKMADDYAKNLTALIKDIRAETKQPNLPFVLGQISEAPVWGPPRHGDIIRAAQLEVARTVPNTVMFPTADLNRCDRWHYDTAGMVALGERFAAAMLKLEAQAKPEAPHKRAKEFTVENKYLIMPVQNNAKGEGRGGDKRKTLMLYIDGKAVRQYNMRLAPSAELADWYAFFTISNYKGRKARVEATATEAGFALIKQSDTVPGEENFYKEPHRPQFHFTQKVGWSNDVNGLVYQDNKWHFFFQYNPVEVLWGNMTWGHAVSEDLLHWEQRANALFPGCMAKGACWSGSATLDKKNTAGWGENAMVALFTDIGNGEAVAYSIDKGETFTYYEGNPVVKHEGRDPKIFWYAYGKEDKPLNEKAQDLGGHWVMAVFQSGGVAFYTSTNLKDWTEQSHLPGYFECIDLIKLPVDGDANNTRWVVYGGDAKYAVGRFDGSKFTPEHEGKYQVHFGAYYAAQTFDNSPDGRKIQIGWVQVNAPGPYNQHFSFPHCLTLHKTGDGIRMFAAPIKEIETLRVKTNKAKPRKLAANKPVDLPVASDLLDIRLTVEVANADAIELNVPGSIVKYDVKAKMLDVVGRSVEGKKDKRSKGVPLTPVEGKISLQILVDRALMEIAGNGGRVYISGAGPGTKVDVNKVSVTATGGDAKLVEFEAHELKSIWNAAAFR